MSNEQANPNTQEVQTDSDGLTTLECHYQGLSREDLKSKQILTYQLFVLAVSSSLWDETPPAMRMDMCHLVTEIYDTMDACHELYSV